MHDFFCTNADEMFYGKLADRVRYFKEDERGIESMSKIVEDMCKEAALETSKEIARKMLTDGNNPEKVAEYVGLTLAEIKDLSTGLENVKS